MPGSQLSTAERVIALAGNRFPAALYKRCRSALVNLDFLAINNRSDGDESAVSAAAAGAVAVDAAVDGVDSAAAVADVDAVAGDGTAVSVLSAAAARAERVIALAENRFPAGAVDAAVDGVDSAPAVADVDAVASDGTTELAELAELPLLSTFSRLAAGCDSVASGSCCRLLVAADCSLQIGQLRRNGSRDCLSL